jgi:hypothetical protein
VVALFKPAVSSLVERCRTPEGRSHSLSIPTITIQGPLYTPNLIASAARSSRTWKAARTAKVRFSMMKTTTNTCDAYKEIPLQGKPQNDGSKAIELKKSFFSQQ